MSEISFYGTGFIAEPLKPRLDMIYQTILGQSSNRTVGIASNFQET